METTDGRTRWAISATDPTGRSMVDEDLTRFTERPKSDPVEEAVNVPAISPTPSARTIADLREIDLFKPFGAGASHHGLLSKSLTAITSLDKT